MAQLPNTNALTVSDGLTTYLNFDTKGGHEQHFNADLAFSQSATDPDPGANGTIATAALVVSRVNPAAARTGCILQAGTQSGQIVWVVNEAASANSITFAASGTSNVADGTADAIVGLSARLFVWDGSTSLWYPVK
ncbi:MAG TPA: hypothetical protein VKV40_01400 [Ktedonobacteraceae bacterium]|nr:hypothetical protein [Ktedonobacteraceae bacterium]